MSLNIEWAGEHDLYDSRDGPSPLYQEEVIPLVRLDELTVFLGDIEDTLVNLINLIPDIGKLSKVQAIRRELAELKAQGPNIQNDEP